MKFVSTRGGSPAVSFRTALLAGLAPDGGLYVPDQITPLAFDGLRGASLVELGTEIAGQFVGAEMAQPVLGRLLAAALDFPVPLITVDERSDALELYHGPTFAFKDIGARVMARLMAHFNAESTRLTILVATSGDTGSAVAHAFFGVDGTRVVVLFPEGAVTAIQEAQFTTLGGNVSAVAVGGTFDDCQRLVKAAFANDALRTRAQLTSANSINIGRLLPQVFYYAYAALRRPSRRLVFSVPSGNFGNLTAGLLGWRLGAPIRRFVAATTINDTLPRYLDSGRYEPRPSIATLANAMDVGDPSNVERVRWLFGQDVAAIRRMVTPSVHTDADVRMAIRLAWDRHGYVCDPHTAIAYLGRTADAADEDSFVFLATAHPAKFRDTVESVLGRPVPLPAPLAEALERPRQTQRIGPEMSELVPLLLDMD
jgi:threonine synthase